MGDNLQAINLGTGLCLCTQLQSCTCSARTNRRSGPTISQWCPQHTVPDVLSHVINSCLHHNNNTDVITRTHKTRTPMHPTVHTLSTHLNIMTQKTKEPHMTNNTRKGTRHHATRSQHTHKNAHRDVRHGHLNWFGLRMCCATGQLHSLCVSFVFLCFLCSACDLGLWVYTHLTHLY